MYDKTCNSLQWNTTGITVAGGNGQGSNSNQFNGQRGFVIDQNNNLYVSDFNNHRVQYWAYGSTTGVTVAGGHGIGNATNQLNHSSTLSVDSNGNMFIGDSYNFRVQYWSNGSTSGQSVAANNGYGANLNQIKYSDGLYVNFASSNAIYTSDNGNYRIMKWAPNATTGSVVFGGTTGTGLNQLYGASTIDFDSSGNLYIADSGNHRILKYNFTGTYATLVAGTSGTSGNTVTTLQDPSGVFIDKNNGNIYVSDTSNHRIQLFTQGSTTGMTIAGGQGSGSSSIQLNSPFLVQLDQYYNLYVSDSGNNRIQKYLTIC
ncbi:unnamed protein product [Didymodactylos carnosus]|uniref:NHL repeat containing protein n=1 Tax=Didymodactylos carnosus TaxID=1234261 RepID=A0A814KKA4_9BILA|nr:unnamed protein product [Didymodactylos carnosus]CAF1050706.1 unnamed protein product [Didymodactylos carnosus]CAF3771039.1 unnamed protein product [Didymodactylos carnosus]CAF3820286.1 unnamed protein product [Didymodactylos carnosus]